MKKILALVATAALIFVGASPVQAGTSSEPAAGADFSQWAVYDVVPGTAVSVNGSLIEGQSFSVSMSGLCPASFGNSNFWWRGRSIVADAKAGGQWLASSNADGAVSYTTSVSLTTPTMIAGQAGTSAYFAALVYCVYLNGVAKNFRSEILKVTFEASQLVGNPTGFTIFPGNGNAFATWGISTIDASLVASATRYTVTALPGGASCTTAENSCTINGLTVGSTYDFTLVASNGIHSSAPVQLNSVVVNQPVQVGVALSGGTWRVGQTVTVQAAVQGNPTPTATVTWYRCDTTVAAAPTLQNDCSEISSGTATSYVLSATDVGKFVTAYVVAQNNVDRAAQLANSQTAVLASGAVAPPAVADPAGKPTIVNIPNPIVSVAGGTQVTITGTGLAGVTAVTVGGLPAIVVSKTDTTVVVQVPISTKVGLADLTITNAQGSVTSKSAIVYTTNPVIKITKTRTLTGFTANQRVLTNGQKAAVRTLLTANPTLTELTCAARTTGVAASKAALANARTLATATCAYAKSLKKTLVTKTSAAQSLPRAKASRTVLLTFKN